MKLVPYKSLGEINFTDSIELIENKFEKFNIKKGIRKEIDLKHASMHVKDAKKMIDIYIVFDDEFGNNIESIEVRKGKILFKDLDLLSTKYSILKDYFSKIDNELVVSRDNFRSPKFGFEISVKLLEDNNYSKFPNIVMLFSKSYLLKKAPSVDDLINHFLNKK